MVRRPTLGESGTQKTTNVGATRDQNLSILWGVCLDCGFLSERWENHEEGIKVTSYSWPPKKYPLPPTVLPWEAVVYLSLGDRFACLAFKLLQASFRVSYWVCPKASWWLLLDTGHLHWVDQWELQEDTAVLLILLLPLSLLIKKHPAVSVVKGTQWHVHRISVFDLTRFRRKEIFFWGSCGLQIKPRGQPENIPVYKCSYGFCTVRSVHSEWRGGREARFPRETSGL